MRLVFAVCVSFALALAPFAFAQGTNVAFGGFRQDTSQPIEVSANALSIDQATGSARYEGDVVIGQGEMRLAAPLVVIVYDDASSQIDRMEASGGVTLVNGAEAAEADSAIYSVALGTVTLVGNVLLTQGANALTSERMVVNLEDGTAKMEGRVRTILQSGDQ